MLGVPERSPYRITGRVRVDAPLWFAVNVPDALEPCPAVLIVSAPLPGVTVTAALVCVVPSGNP